MDLSVIGIILLIGIVKKNSIMLVDFAIAAERDRHLAPEDSIREACLYLDRLQCWLKAIADEHDGSRRGGPVVAAE